MKKKLAILITNLDKGGAETILYNMLPSLQERYDVELFMLNNVIRFELPESLKITILQKKARKSIFNVLAIPFLAWRYGKLLRSKKINCSISFNTRANFIASTSKLFNKYVRIVITENSTPGSYYSKKNLAGRSGRALIKNIYPKADHIICCSQYVAYDLVKNIGIKNRNISTIYNGIDLTAVTNISLQAPVKQLEGFWFVHLGSFYELKNHDLLIRSFNNMCRQTNSKLLLMGKGATKLATDELIVQLDLTNYVDNLGFVENAYSMIRQCSCFVLCSNTEGLPTVIVEAMQLGLPIISTDCFSGPREILAPGTDFTTQLSSDSAIERTTLGILTPVKQEKQMTEALLEMHNNFKDFQNENARKKRVATFSIQRAIVEYYKLLD